jgi:hypothetical protein
VVVDLEPRLEGGDGPLAGVVVEAGTWMLPSREPQPV